MFEGRTTRLDVWRWWQVLAATTAGLLVAATIAAFGVSPGSDRTLATGAPVQALADGAPARLASLVVTDTARVHRLASAAPTTTTTASPPATAPPTTTTAPPTTAAPAPVPPPTTGPPPTTVPPTTTTTAPAPEAAPQVADPARTQHGTASWYDHVDGTCAHRTLPFGTVVTVTSDATGASTTCTVQDRGPFIEGRIIDLDDTVFDDLAPLGAGVISVTISW